MKWLQILCSTRVRCRYPCHKSILKSLGKMESLNGKSQRLKKLGSTINYYWTARH